MYYAINKCIIFIEKFNNLQIIERTDMLEKKVRNLKKTAFTMAEVLITLGVLGIVIAMTLPSLVQNYRKKVVETRLKKFYSAINQAIMLSEKDHGDKKDWYQDLKGAEIDADGNPIEGTSEQEKWFKIYLQPYLNVVKSELLKNGSYIVYLADGGALEIPTSTTRDYYFFPGKPQKCLKKNNYSGHWKKISGICMFPFNFNPSDKNTGWKYHYDKGMEPFKAGWDGNIETLKTHSLYGCYDENTNHFYCTALIQMNNWKIPKEYPHNLSY